MAEGGLRWRRVPEVSAVVALVLLPFLCIGGCLGPIWLACNTPPPLGPLLDRLPEGVEIVQSDDWCGRPTPEAYRNTWLEKDWCARVLKVRQPGVSADALAGEVGTRFRDFDGNYNSVDLGFVVMAERHMDRAPDSDLVLVMQARGC